jgi:hypothetical protein
MDAFVRPMRRCAFFLSVAAGVVVASYPVTSHSELLFRSPEHVIAYRPGESTPTPQKSCPDMVRRATFDARGGDAGSLSFSLGDGAPGLAPLSGEIEYVCSAGRVSEWRWIVARGQGRAGKGGFYSITPEVSWSSMQNSRLLRIGLAPTPPKSNQNYISVRSPRVTLSEVAGRLIFSIEFEAGHGNHGWGRGRLEVRTNEIVDCRCPS